MRKYIAEFIGTMVLTLFGCGAAALTGGIEGELGTLGIAAAFGLAVVAMAYAIGDISGCHINPAVSLAMLIDQRITVGDFVGYIIAQFLGAFAGSGVLAAILICSDSFGDLSSGLGANGFGDLSYVGINMAGAIVVEVILTFVFVLTVLGATDNLNNSSVAGIVIGLTLMFVHILGIPLTGTGVNPARSLAPAVFSIFSGMEALIQVWVFIVGPFAGAALAALLYRFIIAEDN